MLRWVENGMMDTQTPQEISPELANALWEHIQGQLRALGDAASSEREDTDSIEHLLDGSSDESLAASKWDG